MVLPDRIAPHLWGQSWGRRRKPERLVTAGTTGDLSGCWRKRGSRIEGAERARWQFLTHLALNIPLHSAQEKANKELVLPGDI